MNVKHVAVPEETAARAAEWKYALELVADDRDDDLEALATLHGWKRPRGSRERGKLDAMRYLARKLTGRAPVQRTGR